MTESTIRPGTIAPERAVIDIESIPFDGMLKTKMTTTKDLANMVNAIFKQSFHDYEGCTIQVDQMGQLRTSIFFKDKGETTTGKTKNLVTAKTFNRTGSAIDRIASLNAANSNKNYVLSEDTMEMLKPYISYMRVKQDKVQWNQICAEVKEQNYGGYNIYLKVSDLDILKIIKAVYGNKDKETKSYLDYQITLIRPVSAYAGDSGNFLVSIAQVNNKEVEELCKEIGAMPVQGSLAMFRA